MNRRGVAVVVAGIAVGIGHFAVAHVGGHEDSVSGSTAFTAITPILNVESVESSIAHYTSVLGFKKNWDWPADEEDKTFASISNGEVTVFLSEKGQGARPVWIYYSVDNVDELHEKLARTGAEIRQKPVERPWGAREMLVADKDGHILRIGGPSRSGHGEGGEEHGEGKKEHEGSVEDGDTEEGHH